MAGKNAVAENMSLVKAQATFDRFYIGVSVTKSSGDMQ